MNALKEGLLKLDPGLLLWTIITFIVLVLILWKSAWKPIINALDSRAEKIRKDIEEAGKTRSEAEQVLNRYNEMLDNAKEETAKIIADGKAKAEKISNDIVIRARKDAEGIAERSRQDIALARDAALNDLKVEIANISTAIAAKIIQKNLRPEDQEAIVKDTLSKIDNIQ
jgi:F-type H+-transporting ATPase subunit b